MTQNIYDDERFFTAYSRLRRSVDGLDGAPEWPTMRAMLPDVAGRSVLDLGCGFGWFCRWAAAAGARNVIGIDLSRRMLERARRDTTDPRVTYRRGDLEAIELGHEAFDLVYSSLTLHYVAAIDRLATAIRDALVPGGTLVASIEHPMFTAPSRPGFVPDGHGGVVWPVDRYFDESERITDWLAPGVVKQHRTLGTYVATLRRAGLDVSELVEWRPSAEQIAANPEWSDEAERPAFLIVAALRS
jgi:SAM-dependent methyltransferase